MAVKKKSEKVSTEKAVEDKVEDQVVSEENTIKEEPTQEEKYNELNNRFLRLYAEFENYRKRTNKERLDLITNANSDLLKDLVPVIDDFERAIANNVESNDIDGIKEGFSLIYTKYKGLLQSKGLKAMDAKGNLFDSELHEAIANLPTEDKKMKGKVIDDVEKGYFLNDKVLRFAKVVVGQ
ncbi:MAG: nucleotide exchange factor GrpE [Crocinitomicaceae bacterium]|tara:strand:- start:1996 stop:2538 length:543 start_codon:yes stop_codon:yes gene_type:complete